ncbi:MAG: alpha/beta hydrolase-fold protein [Bdellovibrio sp.]
MRLKFILPIVGAVILSSYIAWSKISSPSGDQVVSYTPSSKTCFSSGTTRTWRYCVYKPANGITNKNIAYMLHGRNLDENTWNDDTFYTAMIQKYWDEHKMTPPVVVTVSFGPIWLLTQKGKAEQSGLIDVFTDEVIPEIEHRIGKPEKRFVFGESMGGLNSLLLGLTRGSHFQKVAALCPAIYKDSPFSSLADTQAFLKRTGADPKVIFGIIKLSIKYFADDSEWKQSSPIHLIDQVASENLPEFYLSCGLYDVYGNFEGNQYFAEQALKRGIHISWHPMYGGHCAIDVSSLAEFLVK